MCGSYGGASREDIKKARSAAMKYVNARNDDQGQSDGPASSAEQPVDADAATTEEASSLAASSSYRDQESATSGQQYRRHLENRHLMLRQKGAAIPASTRVACAMPIGRELGNELMAARLCHAAFRDQLVRSIRYGVIKLLTACDTQELRKPLYSRTGPAREGAVIQKPKRVIGYSLLSASEADETAKDVTATDAGHLCHHIVLRALIAVADMVHDLQETERIAVGVVTCVPDTYRHDGELKAEDAIEAALWAGGSSWTMPGRVRFETGPMDPDGVAAKHLAQLIAKTQD